MTDRVKVDWRIPSDEWEKFVAYVRDEHGETEGYVGREAERAMREFVDADEFAAVEERVDRFIQAAGRTPAVLGEKNLSRPHRARRTARRPKSAFESPSTRRRR